MKKIMIALGLSVGICFSAQESSDNVFNNSGSPAEQDVQNQVEETGPGGPGDPVPVDNYLPLLLVIGTGIIVWKMRASETKA